MLEKLIEVNNLTKRYGDITVVDEISFSVQKGEIFGLLGPNGAGKTTTLECLEGIRRPDSGTLRVLEADPVRHQGKLRELIGVQLQSSALPAHIRVDEAMKFFCAYHRVTPRFDLLERLGLHEKMRAQYQTLSTGQKRRLALALAVAVLTGMTLLTATISGLTGLGGALLDHVLKSRGLESHALRVATIFLVMATLTFGTAWLVVITLGGGQAVLPLQQYAFLGGFLGLTFGIVFTLITYRIEKIQQKLRLLEIKNRYLAELAEKDRLLQEAARNMAVAEERNRMARELHDSISQGIHGIVFSLHSLRQQTTKSFFASKMTVSASTP